MKKPLLRPKAFCFFFLIVMSSIFSQTAQGIGVFIPAGSDSNEGDSYIPVGSPANVRLQVLYDASLFKDLLGGGGFLRTIYLRADQLAGGNVVGVLTGVEIAASTSQKESSSLSPIFAENMGSDATVMLDSKFTQQFSSNWSSGDELPGFIPIGLPEGNFLYDPAKGNLLLDFQNLHFQFGWDSYLAAKPISVQAAMSDLQGPKGELGFDAPVILMLFSVPEPGTLPLLLGGAAVAYAMKRKRRDSDVSL